MLASNMGIIWPFAHMRITFAQRLTLLVDGVGEGPETISHIFQECPQLAVERADTGVSNPRDLWSAPAVALRFVRAIGLIPGLS